MADHPGSGRMCRREPIPGVARGITDRDEHADPHIIPHVDANSDGDTLAHAHCLADPPPGGVAG